MLSVNTTLKLLKKQLKVEQSARKPVVYFPSFITTTISRYEFFALQSLKFIFILIYWGKDKKKTPFLFFVSSSHTPSFKALQGTEVEESSCPDIYIAVNAFNALIVELLLLDTKVSVKIYPDRKEERG